MGESLKNRHGKELGILQTEEELMREAEDKARMKAQLNQHSSDIAGLMAQDSAIRGSMAAVENRVVQTESRVDQVAEAMGGKADRSDVLKRSYNLCDISKALDKRGISATTGAVTNNSSYWITDKVPVTGPFVISRQPYNVYFYRADDTLIRKTTGTEMYGVQVPPEGCTYIRAAFSKSSLPFEEAWMVGVFPADGIEGFKNAYESAVDVKPLCESAVLTADKTFSVFNDGSGRNVIISACVRGHGSISFAYAYPHRTPANKGLYASMVYPIDVQGAHEVHEWRVPPFPDGCTRLQVKVTVAPGAQVDLRWIRSRFDDTVRHSGITYHSHFGLLAGEQTVQAAINAAKVGFRSFVMVPKETADGVLVCFHDDDKVGTKLKMPDGSALPAADQAKPISAFTYAQLQQFDAGWPAGACFAGQKLATVEQILQVCTRTGMKPMFSVHPDLSDAGWQELKRLLEKYGLMHRAQVKGGGTNNIKHAHRILGDDIDSYIVDVNGSSNWVKAATELEWFDRNLVKIEFFEAYATEANIKAALDAGMVVSSAESTATVERRKQLIGWGVTEFTEDVFYSFGLNY